MEALAETNVALESLWATEEVPQDEPLLARSQVIQTAQERATYAELTSRQVALSSLRAGQLGAQDKAVVQRLEFLDNTVKTRGAELEKVALAASTAAEVVSTMHSNIRKLEGEEQMLLQQLPPQPNRLSHVRRLLDEGRGALTVQHQIMDAQQLELVQADAALREVETELEFMLEEKNTLAAGTKAAFDEEKVLARSLRAKELRAATGYLKQASRKEQQQAEAAVRLQRQQEARQSVADEEQRKAKLRLREKTQQLKVQREVLGAAEQALDAQRIDAIMELKQSIDAVRARLALNSSTARQLRKQKKEMQAAEFESLQEQGLNPYQVFRQRDIDTEVREQKQKIQNNILVRKEQLSVQLAKEEEVRRKQLKKQEAEAAIQAAYQKEMGVIRQQQHVENYITSHTEGHLTMLDPTGRMPVNPSSVMLAKTVHFGLGGTGQRQLDLVTARQGAVNIEESLLVPRTLRQQSQEPQEGNASSDDETSAEPPSSSTWLTSKPKSKLEFSTMKAAQANHKLALSQPKMMSGRLFAGDAFKPTPTVVSFIDFEVGQVYTAKLVITNTAYSKNTFRVLELPYQIMGIVEVQYQLPGYMAPGTSCTLTVTFTPKVNEDITSEILCLAETGPFSVPLECRIKTAKLSIPTPLVDLGVTTGTVLGDVSTGSFTIVNDGALEVHFAVDSAEEDGQASAVADAEQVEAAVLNTKGFSISPTFGVVPGYGKATVQVHFQPTVTGKVRLSLDVRFKAVASRKLALPSGQVTLLAAGRDVPVFVEQPLMDFKCCMFDHMYRDKLVLHNIGKAAMKVSIVKRPELDELFEFLPDFGYCQAGASFPISICFKPTEKILSKCKKHVVDIDNKVLEIPMKAIVQGQTLPVQFSLRAQVTNSTLELEPTCIDFGDCNMGEFSTKALALTNKSALTQTFSFGNLPRGVRIEPNDGYGTILPGEALARTVCFQPVIAGPQSFGLSCQTVAGRKFPLTCKANGLQPGVRLSPGSIKLPATAIMDTATTSIAVVNSQAVPQLFEFMVPPESNITLSPHVGVVPPCSTIQVQLDFRPGLPHAKQPEPSTPAPAAEAAAEAPAASSRRKSSGGANPKADNRAAKEAPSSRPATGKPAEADPSTAPAQAAPSQPHPSTSSKDPKDSKEAVRLWNKWVIPCHMTPHLDSTSGTLLQDASLHSTITTASTSGRPPGSPATLRTTPIHLSATAAVAASAAAAGAAAGGSAQAAQVVHLGVETCGVEAELHLDPSIQLVPGRAYYQWDFGAIPIGEKAYKAITITNAGETPAPLQSEPLDPHGVFSLVAALRPVAPGDTFSATLCFNPRAKADYYEMFTIKSPKMRLRIALKGSGVAPELQLTPASAYQGVRFADVLRGEKSEQQITLTNTCPFRLPFTLKLGQADTPTLSGVPPFAATPSAATLEPGSSLNVTLTFQPDHQRPYFTDCLLVLFPNQQEEMAVPLAGACWETGAFVSGGSFRPPGGLLPPGSDPMMETQLGSTATATAASTGRMEMVLELKDPALLGGSSIAVLEVGSLKSQQGGSGAELQLQDLTPDAKQRGWSIDATKVTAAAGEKKSITITYTAPASPSPAFAAYYGVSEWQELGLEGVLKGGVPAPPSPAGFNVRVRVRCKVLPVLSEQAKRTQTQGQAAGQAVKGGK